MLTHNSSIHITERMSGYPQLNCWSGWKTWTEEGGHHKKKTISKRLKRGTKSMQIFAKKAKSRCQKNPWSQSGIIKSKHWRHGIRKFNLQWNKLVITISKGITALLVTNI